MSENKTSQAVEQMTKNCKTILFDSETKKQSTQESVSMEYGHWIAFAQKFKRMEEALEECIRRDQHLGIVTGIAQDALSYDPLTKP